jgi:hypothetical protein
MSQYHLKEQFKTAGMFVVTGNKKYVQADGKMYPVSAMRKYDWEALAALVFKTPKSNYKSKPKAKPKTTTKKPSHS